MARLRGYRLTEMALPTAVWALHFIAVYSLAGLACGQDWQRDTIAGFEGVTWLIIGVTLCSWTALAFLGAMAWRGRRAQPPPDQARDATQQRRRFVSSLTLALCAAAALAVTINVLPVFLLPTCAG
jgi:predicted signal transduction protein with EAL and GGDEF domain